MKASDVLAGAAELGKYAFQNRGSQVKGAPPSFDDLVDKIREIDFSSEVEAPVREEMPNEQLSAGREAEITQGTACIPCSQDHWSTCSGLLAEALRFARTDGLTSEEVISRIGLCRDEANAMERVDLRPENTMNLPTWEKEIANDALNASRGLRHALDAMATVDDLEKVAGKVQAIRTDIGKRWLKGKSAHISETDKERVKQKAHEIIDKELEAQNG